MYRATIFWGWGRVHPADANESFCMTVLALKVSRAANGVSELHGESQPSDVAVALSKHAR